MSGTPNDKVTNLKYIRKDLYDILQRVSDFLVPEDPPYDPNDPKQKAMVEFNDVISPENQDKAMKLMEKIHNELIKDLIIVRNNLLMMKKEAKKIHMPNLFPSEFTQTSRAAYERADQAPTPRITMSDVKSDFIRAARPSPTTLAAVAPGLAAYRRVKTTLEKATMILGGTAFYTKEDAERQKKLQGTLQTILKK